MAKDDYYVLAYRILAYLYVCLKQGQNPSMQYLVCDSDDFPVGKDYWNYIFEHLFTDGYIEGVTLLPIMEKQTPGVKLTERVRITPAGIDYLQNNSAMQKALGFLKNLKEIIPGI